MNISATVDIIGYSMTSGSMPFLNVTKDMRIVNKERVNPRVIVASVTIKIPEKSAKVILQNKMPKSIETMLIAMLVSKVITVIALNNM
jgi:hypothetical protein